MPYIASGSLDGYHNAHPDVAFASSSFRNAIRFAKILGVDSDMAAAWQKGLDSMYKYALHLFLLSSSLAFLFFPFLSFHFSFLLRTNPYYDSSL